MGVMKNCSHLDWRNENMDKTISMGVVRTPEDWIPPDV